MDISTEMVLELKCIKCDKFLTCGPIFIRNTSGEAICGRCIAQEDQPVTRNKQYEIIARKIRFPCAYVKNGCLERIQFTENNYNNHELNCQFRGRICPVSKSGECEWIGTWTKLVEHCKKFHPNNVFNNPCTLKHDITTESLNAYVVSAFDLLFILHVKVCVKTAKIYHSLRYLGNPKTASNYKYKLDVQRGEILLSKPGKVAPEGILTIQINSSLELCVNSLLGFLGEYSDTTFTITVQKVVKPAAVPIPKIKTPELARATNISNQPVTDLQEPSTTTNTSKPEGSSSTTPTSHCARKYSGCHYKETESKCLIHERYYCMYLTSCFLCNERTYIAKIQQHYLQAHSDVTHQTGCAFRINPAICINLWKYCLISSTMGDLICWYTFNDLYFEIEIITPLPSGQLNKYQCLITIINVKSKRDKTFFLPRSTNSNSDWSHKILRANVTYEEKKFDIAVLLTEA